MEEFNNIIGHNHMKFNEGYNKGLTSERKVCPYICGTQEYVAWNCGYVFGKYNKKKIIYKDGKI